MKKAKPHSKKPLPKWPVGLYESDQYKAEQSNKNAKFRALLDNIKLASR